MSDNDDFSKLLSQKLKEGMKTSNDDDFFPELDDEDKEKDEKDVLGNHERISSLIGLSCSIHEVNAISVTLLIATDSVERVWCQAVPEGTSVDPTHLPSQLSGEAGPKKQSTVVCILISRNTEFSPFSSSSRFSV